MRRALVWLNLYGRDAAQHKLKNRPKMHFLCFLAIFELMSNGFFKILMIKMVYSQNSVPPNISAGSVLFKRPYIHAGVTEKQNVLYT